jgi:hypothetical protein
MRDFLAEFDKPEFDYFYHYFDPALWLKRRLAARGKPVSSD